MSENKQFGRTFFDFISEYPRWSFVIFIVIIIAALLLKIPIKFGDLAVGEQIVIHDTITVVKHDTVYIPKIKYVTQKTSDGKEKMSAKEINVTSNNQQGGQTANEINNNY